MNTPEIYFILGTRAQVIKMAPVIRECLARQIRISIIHTGQHKETIKELFGDFEIKEGINYIYHGPEISGLLRMFFWLPYGIIKIIALRHKLFTNRNGWIVVHGDTVSTLMGAIVGKILKMRVAHVESGLRSFNLLHPFPEELIRLMVFRLCDVAFCPGAWATKNMSKYSCKTVDTITNTIIDSVRYVLNNKDSMVESERSYGVASIHRFENIFSSNRLAHIVHQIELASKITKIIFVLHPATKRQLEKFDLLCKLSSNPKIQLVPRMGYSKFIRLAIYAKFVITDGGSNQEELSLTNTPVFLMRKATERIEGLEKNVILGCYDDNKFEKFISLLYQFNEPLKIAITDFSPSKLIVSELTGSPWNVN